MKKLLPLLLFILMPVWAFGATYYVNPDATGAGDGSSFENGYTSINAVFSARTLSASDVVELDGGTSGKSYTVGSTAIINVGTNDVGFTIRGSSEAGHNGLVTIDGSTGTVHGIYLPADIAANTVTFERMTVKAGAAKNCALLRAQCIFNDVTFDASLTSGGTNFPVDISGAYTFAFNRSPIINTGASRLIKAAGDAQVTWTYSKHTGQNNSSAINAVWVSDAGAGVRTTFASYNNGWTDLGAGVFSTVGAYADIVSKNDIIAGINSTAHADNTTTPFYAETAGGTIKLYNAIINPGARIPTTLSGGSGTVTIDATCKQYSNPLFRSNKYTGRVAVTIDTADKSYVDAVTAAGDTYGVPISIAVYQYGLLSDTTYKWASTEAEVKALMLAIQARGHEFVNHTISHPHLADTEGFKATYTGAGANPRIEVAGAYPNLTVSAVTDSGTDVGPLDVTNASYATVAQVRLAINAHADWATAAATNAVSGTRSKGLKVATTAVGTGTSIPLDPDNHWQAEITDMTTWLESFLGANSTKAFIIPFATRTAGLDYTAALQTWLADNIAATHCSGARTMQYIEGSDPVSTLRYVNLYGAANATNRMGIGTIPTSLIVSGGTGSTAEATIRNNARAVFLWAAETGNPVVITGHGTECSATEMGYILDELNKSGVTKMKYGDLVEWLVSATALTDASDYRLRAGSPAINAGTSSVSGTVSLANIRLSLVSTALFVDFSAAGTLTPYVGGYVTLTDSAGKTARARIVSAGTGETVGDELVTNGTFTSDIDGWSLTANGGTIAWDSGTMKFTEPATSVNMYAAQSTSTTAGALYKAALTITATDNNYSYIRLGTTSGANNIGSSGYSGTGTVSVYRVAPSATIWFTATYAGGGTRYANQDDASLKQVLTPSATGVVTSAWTIESGFNYNDAGGYTYLITDFLPTTDYLGKPIRGGVPDIGAYEFQSVGGGLGMMGIIYGY